MVELAKSDSGSEIITDNNVFFSAVRSYGPIRLPGESAFMLVPFYPNQCRFLVGSTLGGLLAKMLVFHAFLRLASIEAG